MTDHAWSGERRQPVRPTPASAHYGSRAHAGAHRTTLVAQASPLSARDQYEVASELAQRERERDFIVRVNALGGMPRTAIINGYPVAVNGAGVPWRMAEGA